jgi:hypothetical protein
MGQNGVWGGNPEVYAAAWFYGVDITIYSQEYVNTDGILIIKADGPQGNDDHVCVMWNMSYQGNNHYNSIQSPGNLPLPIQHITNVQHYQAYLQQALDNYQDDFTIIALMLRTNDNPIPPHKINSLRKTTGSIMSYIALQLLGAGGGAISESHLKFLHAQAEEGVMEFVRKEPVTPSQEPCPETSSTTHYALLHYKAELRAAIDSYRDKIFQLLMSRPTSDPLPDLTNHYDEL